MCVFVCVCVCVVLQNMHLRHIAQCLSCGPVGARKNNAGGMACSAVCMDPSLVPTSKTHTHTHAYSDTCRDPTSD